MKCLKLNSLIFLFIVLPILVMAQDTYENADDICYEEPISDGLACFDMGVCKGGVECKNTYPLKNIGDDTLTNVKIIYDETGLGGSFGSSCGVDPSGTCTSQSDIDMGPVGTVGQTTLFTLDNDIPAGDDSNSIWAKNFTSGSCFNGENLYATYEKDGQLYRGKIQQCAAAATTGGRDFELRHQENLRGDIKAIGNTVLCILNSSGQCVEPNNQNSNAGTNLQKAPISSATLTLPDGATVKYARIYWQGRKEASSSNNAWDSASKQSAGHIKLKKDDSSYETLTADILDVSSTQSTNWIRIYSASADASNVVTGSGTYEVDTSSFYTSTGKTSPKDGLGNYGAWMLVVVYNDPTTTETHNVTIFDGYKTVAKNNAEVNINVSGFLTPKINDVNSNLYAFAAEGDKYITGDHLKMAGERHNTTLRDIAPTTNNAFDSRIDISAARNPNLTNNNGIDIQEFDVGSTGKDIITNNETGAKFQFTSTQDTYFPSVLVFSTQIYAPRLCYDYTYGQDGHFITAPSINPPLLDGTFDNSKPINVKLYFKNLENSDIAIKDLTLDVDPIDITRAKYRPESVFVTRPNETMQHISDSDLNVSNAGSYVNNISIGDLDALEYFYTYYSLDTNQTTINAMPINITLNYNLHVTLDGVDTDLGNAFTRIEDMDPCQSNSQYQPVPGIFNIVHNGQSKSDDPYYYFNLPTQVVGRAGNYKIESMDPNDLNTSKTLQETTIVAVEMLDVAGFHYATATCTDQNTSQSSSSRIWVTIDANTNVQDLDKTAMKNAGFFNTALKDAAFRISYNSDTNGSLLALDDLGNGQYKLENFPAVAGDTCADGFVPTTGSSNQVVTYCGNNGQGSGNNGMDQDELRECMECIYGINTKIMCSRDNFAIRPESYSFKFTDYNHSNPSQQSFIIDNNGSTEKTVNLAAGYNYLFTINATDYLNTTPVPGYTTSNLDANMTWQGTSSLDCNNESNITLGHAFINGVADSNTTWNNIGKYKLHIIDTHWTAVDGDSAYMQHHQAPYFQTGTDCIQGSDRVKDENSSLYNGCNINSNHLETQNSQKYFQDMDVIYHPYKFDLNATNGGIPITPSIGLLFTIVPNTTPYIYIADINNSLDENMSYHLNGSITALGENNVILTNFVDKCYATPLDINITTSNRDLNDSNGNHVDYRVRFHDLNSSNNVITALDINVTDDNTTSHTNDILIQTVQTSTKGYFPKNLNGTMQTRLNMNYVREKDTTINPTTLTFIKYQVNCTNAGTDCTFNADLINNKTTKGIKDLNSTIPIRHYYGRTHAPRTTINGSDGNVSMYYEVFCNGVTCNKALLQDGTNSNTTDDPRWFVNTKHTNAAGVAAQTTTIQKNAAKVTVTREANGNHPDYIGLHYDGASGYPYKATMENNASNWLIYNKYNANATTNEFEVEFIKPGGDWAGVHETNSTTNKNASDNTNRRLMW